jgi:hypothetical protein
MQHVDPSTKRARRSARPRTATPKSASIARHDDAALVQAAELAWAGEHERAIELCNRVLEGAKASARRLDALDLRAESHIALGRFDLALHDVETMTALAATTAAPEAQAKTCKRSPAPRKPGTSG